MKDEIDASAFCFGAMLVMVVASYVVAVIWSIL